MCQSLSWNKVAGLNTPWKRKKTIGFLMFSGGVEACNFIKEDSEKNFIKEGSFIKVFLSKIFE